METEKARSADGVNFQENMKWNNHMDVITKSANSVTNTVLAALHAEE